MFNDFDFSVLDSPEFKEDAVREEIIAPIIRRLGYRPSGSVQVQRSKPLVHPFVMIGSKRHVVNIIPDYTLFEDGIALAVLEAKGPREKIVHSYHVEQAYSYAIHPDVRVKHYGLCNGRDLVIYSTDQWEPVLHLSIREIDEEWAKVEETLLPRFLNNPEFRGFAPDYGLAMMKAGFSPDVMQLFVCHHLQALMRVTDDLCTVCTTTMGGDVEYLVTLDLSSEIYHELLQALPTDAATSIADALSHAPFQADVAGKVIITCAGYFDEVTKGEHEEFVPIRVSEISDVIFDPTIILTPYGESSKV
jgi:Type I restriction enzyme R protein N terminus (HSDR_N)